VDEDDSDILDQVISEEYEHVQEVNRIQDALPVLRLRDDATRPLGYGSINHGQLSFDTLVDMRRRHQTKQASQGVRTKLSKPTTENPSMRANIIREFHNALKEAQDEAAVGTGVERAARWRAPAPGGREGLIDNVRAPDLYAGNSANAAVTAAVTARKVSHHPIRRCLKNTNYWLLRPSLVAKLSL